MHLWWLQVLNDAEIARLELQERQLEHELSGMPPEDEQHPMYAKLAEVQVRACGEGRLIASALLQQLIWRSFSRTCYLLWYFGRTWCRR